MTCGHSAGHVTDEVKQVPGVSDVIVDLDAHAVTVSGAPLDDRLIRAAIIEAGYEVVAGDLSARAPRVPRLRQVRGFAPETLGFAGTAAHRRPTY